MWQNLLKDLRHIPKETNTIHRLFFSFTPCISPDEGSQRPFWLARCSCRPMAIRATLTRRASSNYLGRVTSPRPVPTVHLNAGRMATSLRPLTPHQIVNHFGEGQDQPAPTKEEAEIPCMLLELLEKGNSTVRTTVTTDIPTSGNGAGRRLVSWSGIATYYEF